MIRVGKDHSTGEIVELPIPGDGGAHWLVGGSSQAGKSNLAHALIAQLAPLENTAIVVSDPAWMDYEHIWGPRLSCVALARKGAAWLLERVEAELEWRLQQGRRMKVRRLPVTPELPRLVVVFDELAMLTLGGPKQAANRLIDIAQVGRKVNLGGVFMTQSPKATVIPRLVTENCPVRVCLRTEEPEQTDAVLGTQRIKAHEISFDSPGEAYVRMPNGSFVHPKCAYEDEGYFEAVAKRTAHLTPVLSAELGWQRLYEPSIGIEGDER